MAPGVVLADEVYGSSREFRDGVAKLKLDYSLAVRSTTTVWALERQPLPPKPWKGKGRRATRMRRDQTHQPITVEQLARELPEKAWREGSKETLRSRFAALRVRPASDRKGGLQPEQWLLMEWPVSAGEPSGYWLARLPVKLSLKRLVGISKHRWVIERDYEELKQELGLGHYEGRNWRGFHHHGTLCIAAYGFLIKEPFFPLSPRRPSWATRRPATSPLPAAGDAEFAPNGITLIRSQRCVFRSPDSLCSSFPAAPYVAACASNF